MGKTHMLNGSDRSNSLFFKALVITFCVFLTAYVIMTNFSNPLLNTFFILITLIIALFVPGRFSIFLLPTLIIYFGFSFLDFSNYLGIVKNQFITLYIFAFVARNFLLFKKYHCFRDEFWKVGLFACLLFCLIIQKDLTSIIKLVFTGVFSILFVVCFKKDKSFSSLFTKSLFFALVSAVVYNLVAVYVLKVPDAQVQLYEKRFSGAGDANNYSLWSVICILLFDYTKCIKFKRHYYIALLFLIFGTIITISMSGIISLLLVLFVKFFSIGFFKKPFNNQHPNITKSFAVLATVLVLISIAAGLEALFNSNSITLKVFQRVINIKSDIDAGDLSSATSSRSSLWEYYLDQWSLGSANQKMFGDYSVYRALLKNEDLIASHNTFIDLLIVYGRIGLFVIVIYLFLSFFVKKRKKSKIEKLIVFIFALNIFFRSFDVQSAETYIFLLI